MSKKPCPFCGSTETQIDSEFIHDKYRYFIECVNCRCKWPPFKTRDPTAEGIVFECIKDWNERIKSDE